MVETKEHGRAYAFKCLVAFQKQKCVAFNSNTQKCVLLETKFIRCYSI